MGNDSVATSPPSGGDNGLFGMLAVVTLVLSILKVSDNLEISWWLVTLPIWIGFVITFVFMIVIMIAEAIHLAFRSKK